MDKSLKLKNRQGPRISILLHPLSTRVNVASCTAAHHFAELLLPTTLHPSCDLKEPPTAPCSSSRVRSLACSLPFLRSPRVKKSSGRFPLLKAAPLVRLLLALRPTDSVEGPVPHLLPLLFVHVPGGESCHHRRSSHFFTAEGHRR
jgi:hypothetical protein